MIIGFLGKGGSGKSTLSSLFTRHLAKAGNRVLAIDADHNMDLTYNLAPEWTGPYFGNSLSDIKTHAGITNDERVSTVFFSNKEPSFQISSTDPYTTQYSRPIPSNNRIQLMSAGPHTDAVLYDQSCSHVLYTPLKIFLPYLQLGKNEYVVVDEKAGADGAGTGIASGFDFAVITSEPTVHGVKAARQIASLLEFHGTPYMIVGNKIMDDADSAFIKKECGPHTVCFPFNKSMVRLSENESIEACLQTHHDAFETIRATAHTYPSTRTVRSKKKFEKNKQYTERTTT